MQIGKVTPGMHGRGRVGTLSVPNTASQSGPVASGCSTLRLPPEPEGDDVDRVAEVLQDHFSALRVDSSMRQAACAAITAARDGWSNGDDAAIIAELRDELGKAEEELLVEKREHEADVERLEASIKRLSKIASDVRSDEIHSWCVD